VYSRGMGIRKSGKLEHAPLFYTLAMIRFEDQQIGSEQINKIRTRLKPGYPRFEERKLHAARTQIAEQVSIEATEITEYHGENAPQTSGFLLRNDALFFHTLDYEKFEQFKVLLQKLIAIVQEELSFEHYQAIGIRYIDYIRRGELTSIEDYVEVPLRGFPLDDTSRNTVHTSCESVAEQGEYTIRLRCSTLPGNFRPVPADLAPLTEHLNVGSNPPEESLSEKFILLDTDCFQNQIELRPFDQNDVLGKFDVMHKFASSVFKKAVTDQAWKEWK